MARTDTYLALRIEPKTTRHSGHDVFGEELTEPQKGLRPRRSSLVVRHRCVKCDDEVVLEAQKMDIWCRPVSPTYMPFPQTLQRDCACGGHANFHVALLPFVPITPASPAPPAPKDGLY